MYNHVRIISDYIRPKEKSGLCVIKSDYSNIGETKVNLISQKVNITPKRGDKPEAKCSTLPHAEPNVLQVITS